MFNNFLLPPIQVEPIDPVGSFMKGLQVPMAMQQIGMKNALMQEELLKRRAMSEFAQTGDINALKRSPEIYLHYLKEAEASKLRKVDQQTKLLDLAIKGAGRLLDNPTLEEYQQTSQSLMELGAPKHWFPDLKTPEEISAHSKKMQLAGLNYKDRMAMGTPKIYPNVQFGEQNQPIAVYPGGEVRKIGSGGPKWKDSPTLLQDAKGNLVPWYPGEPLTGLTKPTVASMSPETKASLLDGLERGDIAPSLLSKRGGDYNTILSMAADRGINLSSLENDYQAAKAFAKNLNSAQQVRFLGLGKSVVNTMKELQNLSEEMKLSGLHLYNKAKLELLVKTAGNTTQGQLASKYMAYINTLKEEFAQLAMGGYAPTEPAFALAHQQVNGNYGVNQMAAVLPELRRLINYRMNAFKEISPIVPSQAQKSGGAQGDREVGDESQKMWNAPPPKSGKVRGFVGPGYYDGTLINTQAEYNSKYGASQ